MGLVLLKKRHCTLASGEHLWQTRDILAHAQYVFVITGAHLTLGTGGDHARPSTCNDRYQCTEDFALLF